LTTNGYLVWVSGPSVLITSSRKGGALRMARYKALLIALGLLALAAFNGSTPWGP